MGNIENVGDTYTGNVDIKSGTLQGNTVSISSTKVGFFGNSASQPSAYTQTYSTATKTQSNISSSAVATTGATNIAPFGYTTAAQADDIITQLNKIRTDLANVKQVLNALIDDMQANGLVL
jgi:hypothetical protein